MLTGIGSPPGDTVTVTLDPTVQAGQRTILALLPQAAGALPTLFDGGTATAPGNTLVFGIGIPPAKALVSITSRIAASSCSRMGR